MLILERLSVYFLNAEDIIRGNDMVMPKPPVGDFERPPTGMQRAVCVRVIDIGLHPYGRNRW